MSEETTTVENTAVQENVEAAPEINPSEDSNAPVDQESALETKQEAVASDSTPETKEDLKEAVEEAIEEGATEEEIKDMIEEFELKVNGKRKKVRVDLNNKEDLKRRLQLAEAGKISMQELAELKKTVNEVLLQAKQNPWDFIEKELNLDTDQLIEARLNEMIEEKKKSPEQLEKEKLLKELEQERDKAKRLQQEREEQMYQAKVAKFQQDLNLEIIEALKVEPGLPKTQKTVRRISDALSLAVKKGIEDVTVADVLPYVKRDIQNEMLEFMSAMPEEMMETYIGKQNIERLRKKRLEAVKKAPKTVESIRQPSTAESKKEEPSKEKVSAKEFFRRLNRQD